MRRRPREIVDGAPLAPPAEDAQPRQAAQDLDRRVRADAEHGEERLAGAIAAQQHHAGAERAERRARVELVAVARRFPGRPLDPRQGAEELRLAVPLRTGDTEDLALADDEVDGAEALATEPGDVEEHLPAVSVRVALGEGERERPPDHERHDGLLRHARRVVGALADAVAEHRDAVGDTEHLGEPVADVDDPDAGPAPLQDERVELGDLLRPQRRGRLVEEQDLRFGEQGLDDLEELAFRERQRPDHRGRRDIEPVLGELRRGPLLHPPVRRPEVPRHREVEVLGNRQVENVGVRLVCDAETRAAGLRRRSPSPWAAADLDDALVRREKAAGNPEQCRFPGPVLADERVDLAGAAVDADVPERLNGSERLRHAPQGQHDGACGPGNRHVPTVYRSASYGYIRLISERGTSDVAEASCG